MAETKGHSVVVLMPVDESEIEAVAPDSRIRSLDGSVMGLLDNHRTNADTLLADVAALLAERFGFAAVVTQQKPDDGVRASADMIDLLAERCSFVINAIAA